MEVRAAFFEDILREKGHRYRRVLIPLCLVLTAILAFPQLDFSDLSFFGVSPEH
jgi:hypothetical protein